MEMRNNNQYYRGDLYWADLGNGVGSEQENRRVVCVVSNNTGNRFSPVVTIVPLTSQQTKAKLPTHVHITKDVGNVPRDSVLLAEQSRTIDKSRLGDKLGRLYGNTLTELDNAIGISIGLIPVPLKGVNEEIIKDKVEEVQGLDNFIMLWKAKGKALKDIKDFIQEREMRLKDLIKCCNDNGVNVDRYYRVEELQRKMVG